MKIIFSILVSLALIAFAPNSFESSGNSTIDSQGNYHNPSLGITFQIPQGWLVQEPKKFQPDAPDIAVVAPYSGGFTPSISFVIENANGTSLEDYINNKKSQLAHEGQTDDIVFLSEQNSDVDNHNARVITLQEKFFSQNNTLVKFQLTITQADDKFYTLTYANEIKNFNAYLSSYDQLINSIKFTNDESLSFSNLSIGIGASIAGIIVVIAIKKKRNSNRNQSSTNPTGKK